MGLKAQNLLTWELVPSANDPSLYDLEVSYGTPQEQDPWLMLGFQVTPGTGFDAENFDQEGTFFNSDGKVAVTFETDPVDGTVTYTLDRTPHGAMAGSGKILTLREVETNTGVEEWLEMKRLEESPVRLAKAVKAPQLSVWPSRVPAQGAFHWQLEQEEVQEAGLLSIDGTYMPLDPQTGRVEVQGLRSGVYHLVVGTRTGWVQRKLIIEAQ